MDSCIYCGGPAGLDVVPRPEGVEHYSKIACAEWLKKKVEEYRKLLWVIVRKHDGLQLHVPNWND
jgi:hypothetical protein